MADQHSAARGHWAPEAHTPERKGRRRHPAASVHECYAPGPGASGGAIRETVSVSDRMGNVGTRHIAEAKVLRQHIGDRRTEQCDRDIRVGGGGGGGEK